AGPCHLFAATSAQLGVESQFLLRLRQPVLITIDLAETIVGHLGVGLKLDDFAKLGRGLYLLGARHVQVSELQASFGEVGAERYRALKKRLGQLVANAPPRRKFRPEEGSAIAEEDLGHARAKFGKAAQARQEL